MTWIEPLDLQTWMVNVMAGNGTIFMSIMIFMIISMAGYFRMNGITFGFLLFVFLLMFSNVVPASLVIFASIIGGLLVGYIIPRLVK